MKRIHTEKHSIKQKHKKPFKNKYNYDSVFEH
jgi:hypothetical protein